MCKSFQQKTGFSTFQEKEFWKFLHIVNKFHDTCKIELKPQKYKNKFHSFHFLIRSC